MKNNGFIVLHRAFLDWEWYGDINTSRLFLHLLLLANHQDVKWQGIVIRRGELVTSNAQLAQQTGLTFQQVRTSLNKLKSTGEITSKSTNQHTLIYVVNWGKYQDYDANSNKQSNKQTNNPITNEQQTDNKRITTNNNDNKYINNNICAFFEHLWDLYPNKKGKNRVTQKALKEISDIGEERMTAAVMAYVKEVEGVDKKYIKHGSTFFNGDYKDYLDLQPVKPKKEEKQMPRLGHDLKG